jgi:hypothetical protein
MLARNSPLQIAKLTVLGSVLVASDFLVVAFVYLMPGFRHYLSTRIADGFGPYAFIVVFGGVVYIPWWMGILLMVRARRRISRGLAADKWTGNELESARQWVESPDLRRIEKWYDVIALALGISWLLFGFISVIFNQDFRAPLAVVIFLMLPDRMLSTLRTDFARPSVPSDGWAGTIKGIYSEHWGGRKPAASDPKPAP